MPKSQHYETFIKGMKETEEVVRHEQEAKGGINPAAADQKLKEYALNFLRTNPLTQNLVPPNFDQLPDDQKQEILQIGLRMGQRVAHESAMQAMDSNLESIVDSDLSEETLGTMLRTKDIGSLIAAADKEVVAKYTEFRRYEEFQAHYESAGKPRNQFEEEIVTRAAIRGYAEQEQERMKGFSQEVQQLAKAFASRAFRHSWRPETTAEYAKPGLKVLADEKKKEYDELAKKGRNIGAVARDAIKGIKKPEQDGGLASPEREKIYEGIYAVETGRIKYSAPTFADYAASAGGQGIHSAND